MLPSISPSCAPTSVRAHDAHARKLCRGLRRAAAGRGPRLLAASCTDTRTLGARRAVRRAARPALQRQRVRRAGACRRRRGRRGRCAAGRRRSRRSSSPRARRRSRAPRSMARPLRHPGDRRRRQQRQDQHQGDDGGDPRAQPAPALPRAAISTITSACRSRCCASRPSIVARSSRWAPIRAATSQRSLSSQLPPSGSSPTRAPSIWKASAVSRRAARAEGEMVEALPAAGTAVINADDPYAPLWRGLTRAQSRELRHERRAQPGVRTDVHCDVDAEGFSTRFTLVSPLGRVPVMLELAGRHNVMNALGCGRRRRRGRRDARAYQSRASPWCARCPGRLQFKRAAAAPGSSMTPTTPIRARCAPASKCWRSSTAANGWCSATWPSSATLRRRAMREVGEFARAHGIERLLRHRCADAWGAVESFGAGGQWFADAQALAAALIASANPACACSSKARA